MVSGTGERISRSAATLIFVVGLLMATASAAHASGSPTDTPTEEQTTAAMEPAEPAEETEPAEDAEPTALTLTTEPEDSDEQADLSEEEEDDDGEPAEPEESEEPEQSQLSESASATPTDASESPASPSPDDSTSLGSQSQTPPASPTPSPTPTETGPSTPTEAESTEPEDSSPPTGTGGPTQDPDPGGPPPESGADPDLTPEPQPVCEGANVQAGETVAVTCAPSEGSVRLGSTQSPYGTLVQEGNTLHFTAAPDVQGTQTAVFTVIVTGAGEDAAFQVTFTIFGNTNGEETSAPQTTSAAPGQPPGAPTQTAALPTGGPLPDLLIPGIPGTPLENDTAEPAEPDAETSEDASQDDHDPEPEDSQQDDLLAETGPEQVAWAGSLALVSIALGFTALRIAHRQAQ